MVFMSMYMYFIQFTSCFYKEQDLPGIPDGTCHYVFCSMHTGDPLLCAKRYMHIAKIARIPTIIVRDYAEVVI